MGERICGGGEGKCVMAVVVSLATRYLDCVEYERSLTSIDEQLFLAYSNESMTRQSDVVHDDDDMDDGESIASVSSSGAGAKHACLDDSPTSGDSSDPFAILPQECCSTILLMLSERDLIAAAR